MGSIGTKISFVIDLIGADPGACLIMITLMSQYPFCKQCNIYKKWQCLHKIIPAPNEETIHSVMDSIMGHCKNGGHGALVKQLIAFEREHTDKKAHI